jgi:hypothetical protein
LVLSVTLWLPVSAPSLMFTREVEVRLLRFTWPVIALRLPVPMFTASFPRPPAPTNNRALAARMLTASSPLPMLRTVSVPAPLTK